MLWCFDQNVNDLSLLNEEKKSGQLIWSALPATNFLSVYTVSKRVLSSSRASWNGGHKSQPCLISKTGKAARRSHLTYWPQELSCLNKAVENILRFPYITHLFYKMSFRLLNKQSKSNSRTTSFQLQV